MGRTKGPAIEKSGRKASRAGDAARAKVLRRKWPWRVEERMDGRCGLEESGKEQSRADLRGRRGGRVRQGLVSPVKVRTSFGAQEEAAGGC